MTRHSDDSNLSLFCDFENIALGVRDAKYAEFDINPILERLLVKGSIVVKKAYCDWERYKTFKRTMHEAAFELIDIPHVRQSGKNSADIRMVVDALDLCYTKSHVDTFVIISGDSDFSPLVSKLRENAKTVIGVGVKNSTSDLLINNCDEFIYYDDLVREKARKKPMARKRSKKKPARNPEATSVGLADSAEDAHRRPDEGEKKEADTKPHPVDPSQRDDGGETGNVRTFDDKSATKGKSARSGNRGDGSKGTERTITDLADILGTDDETDIHAVDFDSAADGDDDTDTENGDSGADDRAQDGLDIVVETALALTAERGDHDKLWGSMVKQTLKRRKPGFNESYYGFDSFGKMLEEAQARGMLTLEHDDRSGGYIISKISA